MASSGIGAKICEVFADAGLDIVAVAADRVPRALHKVVSSRSIASGHRPEIRGFGSDPRVRFHLRRAHEVTTCEVQ